MMQPFVKLITLLVTLLGLTVTLVVGIGLVLFLSFSGVQLPSLSESEPDELLAAAVETPVVQALMDPASLWKAPDWAEMEKEPNAEELNYGKELVANTARNSSFRK